MVGSLIINVLVSTYNGGSPVTSSIIFKATSWYSPKNNSSYLAVENIWVYTPGGSPKKNQYMIYTTMGGSPTTNVIVYKKLEIRLNLSISSSH